MENSRKICLKRLLCVLLSAFIILGFMPFAALSVHAEDDPNTIGDCVMTSPATATAGCETAEARLPFSA